MTDEPGHIDPAITRALRAEAANGVATPRVRVIVELADKAAPGGAGDPAARFVELERVTRVLQQDLIDHLAHLGVQGTPQLLTLANAVVVNLTEDEVTSVAGRHGVRRLILAETRHVAL
ncbi:MAG: hypothetical protein LH603_01890 [Pseudonocardia sp.]|nr:hypothetical protein [Pseudonocardia sp.]